MDHPHFFYQGDARAGWNAADRLWCRALRPRRGEWEDLLASFTELEGSSFSGSNSSYCAWPNTSTT
jgi:hypothetical protein